MRTKYWQRSEARSSGATWGVLALIVALVLVLLRFVAPDLFWQITTPLLRAGTTLEGALSTGGSRAGAEIAALKEENAALALQNDTLAEKVASLTALIGTSTSAAPGIALGVLARPPTAPYDTLLLSGGTTLGAYPGMEVFGRAGTPLGSVVEATAHFSRVRLFSAPGVATDAWVGSARLPITLKGAGAGAFTAALSQGSGVSVGDLVYLAGPGAVPVGKVGYIAGAASDPIARLSVASLVSPFTIDWVVVRSDTVVASTTLTELAP